MGNTYEVAIHRPKEDKLPFICHLVFSAGEEDFGDIVQVSKGGKDEKTKIRESTLVRKGYVQRELSRVC